MEKLSANVLNMQCKENNWRFNCLDIEDCYVACVNRAYDGSKPKYTGTKTAVLRITYVKETNIHRRFKFKYLPTLRKFNFKNSLFTLDFVHLYTYIFIYQYIVGKGSEYYAFTLLPIIWIYLLIFYFIYLYVRCSFRGIIVVTIRERELTKKPLFYLTKF